MSKRTLKQWLAFLYARGDVCSVYRKKDGEVVARGKIATLDRQSVELWNAKGEWVFEINYLQEECTVLGETLEMVLLPA